MSNDQTWYAPIRRVFDQELANDWDVRVAQFNVLPAVQKTKTRFHPSRSGTQPAWFNGNLMALKASEWVLVVSNNPHITFAAPPSPIKGASPEEWWRELHAINPNRANWGRPNVFPQVVELAAAICGVDVSTDATAAEDFAAHRMLLVEFCPFASENWPSINWDPTMKNLADANPGVRTARQIRRLLFEQGQPKAVLCLGQEATWDVRDKQFGEDRLYRMCVELRSHPGETVHMYQGVYTPNGRPSFPVIGSQEVAWDPREAGLRQKVVSAYGQDGADSNALLVWPCPHPWESSPPRQ